MKDREPPPLIRCPKCGIYGTRPERCSNCGALREKTKVRRILDDLVDAEVADGLYDKACGVDSAVPGRRP